VYYCKKGEVKMQILIDTANLKDIEELFGLYPIDGVTTNPTILKKEMQSPIEQLKKIRKIIPQDAQLHTQVVSQNAEDMVKEAHHIIDELGSETFIKVPVTAQGYKAMAIMSNQGISVTATAVHTAMQAYLAAKAGAKYVAPYVNRIDNTGVSGVAVVKDIQQIFNANKMDCKILAASFKNAWQVTELCKCAVASATVSVDVFKALVNNTLTDKAVKDFTNDFHTLTGAEKTMLDF
jgi:fructose-6-phosphate aldolase 1/fructose-6-phosphate aldolase 2